VTDTRTHPETGKVLCRDIRVPSTGAPAMVAICFIRWVISLVYSGGRPTAAGQIGSRDLADHRRRRSIGFDEVAYDRFANLLRRGNDDLFCRQGRVCRASRLLRHSCWREDQSRHDKRQQDGKRPDTRLPREWPKATHNVCGYIILILSRAEEEQNGPPFGGPFCDRS
jgi:hypothetical protein